MKKLLIKFKGNWADEADFVGFKIMSKAEWNYKVKEVQFCDFPHESSVGTNQYIDFESPEDYLRHFDVREISEAEEKIIKKFLLMNKSGSYCAIEYGEFPLMEGNATREFYDEHGHCPE